MKRKAKRAPTRKEKPLTRAELKKIAAGFRQAAAGVDRLFYERGDKPWIDKSDK